jgi:hypothetical protein
MDQSNLTHVKFIYPNSTIYRVLRLSQITKDLAQIQTVVLGQQNFGYPKDTKNKPIDGATGLQRTGSIKFDSMCGFFIFSTLQTLATH